MKKFYAFASAVALTAMSMSAQLYVVGNGTIGETPLAWTPDAPVAIEAEGGYYTFEVKNYVSIQLSTVMGSWDEFNTGAVVATITEDNLGTDIELVAGSGNILSPWKGDYKFVIKEDLTSMVVTTETPKPTVADKKIYIRGGMNDWGAPDEWMFTYVSGNTFKFNAQGATKIPAATSFKIADADWGSINYGNDGELVLEGEDSMLNQEGEWNYNAGDTSLDVDFEGTITFILPEIELDPALVTFGDLEGVESIEFDANAPVEYYNLQGVRVNNPENGLFIAVQGQKAFKVAK